MGGRANPVYYDSSGKAYSTQYAANSATTRLKAAAAAAAEKAKMGTVDPVTGVYTPLVMGTDQYHAASDATAAVLRGQQADWMNTYFPKVQALENMTTYNNPELMGTELADAQKQVGTAFGVAADAQKYQLNKYGMNQTTEQQQANTTADSLALSTASVDAANRTRLAQDERNRSIAMGGLPSAVSGGV